jgi:quercetin dioxygenase-like cupin family protein
MIEHRILSREVREFGSSGVSMQFLVARGAPAPESVNVARIAGGGRLGRHESPTWQVFVVIDGLVEVTAGVGDTQILGPGEAVQWEPGELHESVAVVDSTIAMIESPERIPSEP